MVKSPAMPVDDSAFEQVQDLRVSPLEETQPVRVPSAARRPTSRQWRAVVRGVALGVVVFIYLAWPSRINILLLGIDRTPPGTALGRSDTIIMSTVVPGSLEVSLLSVPRDLWVSIPGFGENRVNAAHFFGEAEAEGYGPQLAMATIEQNFGVDMPYYIRIQFEGFKSFVDRLGGIAITLDQPVGKLPAGSLTLDGDMALAYVRDRSGTDDFTRLLRGQSFLRATVARLLQPATWLRIPAATVALFAGLDMNLPGWQVPRVVFTILRVGGVGIRTIAIDRSMATGFTTAAGAQVLAPNWDRINPILLEIFGQ